MVLFVPERYLDESYLILYNSLNNTPLKTEN